MASKSPALSGRVLLRLVEFCRRRGHDPAVLCRAAGMRAEEVNTEARVPYARVERLTMAALDMVRDPDLGLHLAEDVQETASYDPGLLALLASPTVGAALERFRDQQRYWGDGVRVAMRELPDGLAIRYELKGARGEYRRHADECALAEIALGVRAMAGKELHPRVARFHHRAPVSIREHRRIFGCPLEFAAPTTEIEFDQAVLVTPMPNANPAYLANFERQVSAELGRLADAGGSFGERVKTACRARLANGGAELAEVARSCQVSSRTLQRRLREEGTTFAKVLDALRHELSLGYLAGGCSVAEVAERLGYADATAFHHAFRRWTGTSPLRFSR